MSNLICLGPIATLTVHDKVNLEFNYNHDATEAFLFNNCLSYVKHC